MPKIDSNAPDVQDFTPVPVGKYLCEIVEIEETTTQAKDDMWKLKLEIQEGEFEGRFLFDNVVFSKAAMPRAKLIASRFGLDVSKDLDLEVDMLLNRRAYVTVDRIDTVEGEKGPRQYSKVAFAGYEEAEQKEDNEKPTRSSKTTKAKPAKGKPVKKDKKF